MTAVYDSLGIIYIIPMVLGMGGGILAGLYIYGLLGGLIGILLYKRKILKIPNYKIGVFAGYLVFILFPFILLTLLTTSFYSGEFILLFLPFLHVIIILILLSFFEKKKVTNSLYWSFILSYLLGCFTLGIFGIVFFLVGSPLSIAF